MKQSKGPNPVGIVVVATDMMGSVLYRASLVMSGATEDEAESRLKATVAQMTSTIVVPTALLVVTWDNVFDLLKLTSPETRKNFRS